jgi:hypothetical protein
MVQGLTKATLAYSEPYAQGMARLSEVLGWVGLLQKDQCSHLLPGCAPVGAQCEPDLLRWRLCCAWLRPFASSLPRFASLYQAQKVHWLAVAGLVDVLVAPCQAKGTVNPYQGLLVVASRMVLELAVRGTECSVFAGGSRNDCHLGPRLERGILDR